MRSIRILSKKSNSVVKLVELLDQSIAVVKYYPVYSRSMFIEMNIMATCCHQNIIRTKKLVLINKKNNPKKIKTIGMIMDYLNVNYLDLIEKRKLSHFERLFFLLQIAYGIRYLHSNNILHLDLKTENIMVTDNNCKIIDFGSSEYLLELGILTNKTKCTATHRPPEGFNYLIKKNITIDTTFDIWSFGMIMLETFTNIPIYLNNLFPIYTPEYNYVYDIKMYEYITSNSFKKYVEKSLPIELVSCLDVEPTRRPNINEIICYLTSQLLASNLNGIFKFDSSLTLIDDNIRPTKSANDSLLYYQSIKNTVDIFPVKITWYTECLIRRICYYLEKEKIKINKKYIDQIIMISLQFYNYDNNQTFANNFYDKDILDQIIMLTNGIFFHYTNQK